MKLTEIQDLIKFVAKSGVCEVELQLKDVKIIIKTGGNGKGRLPDSSGVMQVAPSITSVAPSAAVVQETAAAAENKKQETKKNATASSEESKYITIKSPMIGTFYRSPAPDKPAFVNIGDEIKPGKVMCVIEAMKLFNEIESDVSGKIVKMLVDDSSPVEYDQPLFLIDPS